MFADVMASLPSKSDSVLRADGDGVDAVVVCDALVMEGW